jgi:RND family efflux transporter MFP subunit
MFDVQFPAPSRMLGLIVAALGSVALLVSGCNRAATASRELPAPKVTTMAVVSEKTIDADEYQGQTEASESVEIRARVFGYLKSIEFKDGDFVKGPVLGPDGEVQEEGQVLFTIEPDEYDAIHKQSLARIDLNQANLTLAKAKHARNATLVKSGAVTREEFEESAAAVATAEAAITAAQADANRTAVDLKYTVIRAPIDGRIDRAYVSVGNLLTGGTSSGTLLTKIVKESPIYVYFDVDERSLLRYMRRRADTRKSAPGSLRDLGIPVFLQLADETDFVHEGTLDFVETEVSRTTGTARIRGVFANEDRALASGMFVHVQIPVSEPYEALMIPEAALATDQSIKFVYVVGGDGKAERRNVTLGGLRGDMRIITSGLKAGEQVIVKGLQRVKPGQQVEAELAPPPEASATTTTRKPVIPPSGRELAADEDIAPGPVDTAPATSTPRTPAQER